MKSLNATHSIDLIEGLPLLVRDSQVFGGLDAAAQLAGPDLQVLQLLLLHKPSQGAGKLQQRGTGFSTRVYLLGSGRPPSLCRYLLAPR